MIFLLPTYKRLEILPYVLKSILQQDISNIDERKLLLIVNNNPDTVDQLSNVVRGISKQKWNILIHNNEKSIPPVISWFQALFQYGLDCETVVMHGDDDLCRKDNVQKKYLAVKRTQSSMVIGNMYNRFAFCSNPSSYITLDNTLKFNNDKKLVLNKFSLIPQMQERISFISNHVYLLTKEIRNLYKLSLDWCLSQKWLDPLYSTGNIPSLMSIYAFKYGILTTQIENDTILRGGWTKELIIQDNLDNFSTELLLLSLNDFILNGNHNLKKTEIQNWYEFITTSLKVSLSEASNNLNVSRTSLTQGLKISKIDESTIKKFPTNFRNLVRIVGLRGIRIRLKSIIDRHSTQGLISRL